jgi:hypothetical protein
MFGACECRSNLPAFSDGAGDRFRAVDMLVQLQSRHEQNCVGLIRSPDDHGIDVLFLIVEHLSEVMIRCRHRVPFEDLGRSFVVEVT